jgi:hypothetical protein
MPRCVRFDPDAVDRWAQTARRRGAVSPAEHNAAVAMLGALMDAIADPRGVIGRDAFVYPQTTCNGARVPLVGRQGDPGDTTRSRPEHAGGIDGDRGRWWRALAWVLERLRAPTARPLGGAVQPAGDLAAPLAPNAVVALAGHAARAAVRDAEGAELYDDPLAADYAAQLIPGALAYVTRRARAYREHIEGPADAAEARAQPFVDDAERWYQAQRRRGAGALLLPLALWAGSRWLRARRRHAAA